MLHFSLVRISPVVTRVVNSPCSVEHNFYWKDVPGIGIFKYVHNKITLVSFICMCASIKAVSEQCLLLLSACGICRHLGENGSLHPAGANEVVSVGQVCWGKERVTERTATAASCVWTNYSSWTRNCCNQNMKKSETKWFFCSTCDLGKNNRRCQEDRFIVELWLVLSLQLKIAFGLRIKIWWILQIK